jgi:para-nitrobenzyl esterase
MQATDADLELTKTMQDYWTSFAASGDPNTDATSEWPRFEAPAFAVQELGDVIRTIPAPEAELCRAFSADPD